MLQRTIYSRLRVEPCLLVEIITPKWVVSGGWMTGPPCSPREFVLMNRIRRVKMRWEAMLKFGNSKFGAFNDFKNILKGRNWPSWLVWSDPYLALDVIIISTPKCSIQCTHTVVVQRLPRSSLLLVLQFLSVRTEHTIWSQASVKCTKRRTSNAFVDPLGSPLTLGRRWAVFGCALDVFEPPKADYYWLGEGQETGRFFFIHLVMGSCREAKQLVHYVTND